MEYGKIKKEYLISIRFKNNKMISEVVPLTALEHITLAYELFDRKMNGLIRHYDLITVEDYNKKEKEKNEKK